LNSLSAVAAMAANIQQSQGASPRDPPLRREMDFSGMIPAQFEPFTALRYPVNAGHAAETNRGDTAQYYVRNWMSKTQQFTTGDKLACSDLQYGMYCMGTQLQVKNGRPINSHNQRLGEISLYDARQMNIILDTLHPVAKELSAALGGYKFPPKPPGLAEARAAAVKSDYSNYTVSDAMVLHTYNSRRIAETFTGQGFYYSGQTASNNVTLQVAGRVWEAKAVFPGNNGSANGSNLGFILTRTFKKNDSNWGPYQYIPWSSNGDPSFPTPQEMACVDYLGHHDPGVFVPVGSSVMGAQSQTSPSTFNSAYCEEIFSPDPDKYVGGSAKIAIAPLLHVYTRPAGYRW
jgi:hypothetical protein